MAAMMNLTNVTFLALAYFQPQSLGVVSVAVIIEKFGYGFGFTGYMLYMLYLARGEHQTSFYAICTGFMTLGLILPGSLAGYPLERLGYTGFFVWILIATIPSFVVTWIVYQQLDPRFGQREKTP
jgi:PAT family beta-lactamase induction signal transducer AmpG